MLVDVYKCLSNWQFKGLIAIESLTVY